VKLDHWRLIDRGARTGEPVLVSLLVLLETEWVLRSGWELAKSEIVAAFSALLDTADLAFEDFRWQDTEARWFRFRLI
jgi:hypothetical protein